MSPPSRFPPSSFPPPPFSLSPFLTFPFPTFPFSTFPFSTFPFPPTLRTQSPSHHPIFNPLPSTLMSPPFPFIPPPSTRNPHLNPSRTPPPPNYPANISPCPNNTHASTCHYMIITFPPFKISNSANFPLPNITSPHYDFLPQISRSQHFFSTQFILRKCFSPPPSNFPSSSSPFSFPKFLIIYSYNHSYVIITRIIQFNYSCILSSLTFKYLIIYNTYL